MNSEYFSEALENISEPLIDSAARAYERAAEKQRRRRAIVRVASIAAVLALLLTWLLSPGKIKTDENGNIISAPGILKVYAYDMQSGTDIDEMVRYDLASSVDATSFLWSPLISMVHGIPLTLEIDSSQFGNADIVLYATVNYGKFIRKDKENPGKWEQLGEKFTIGNGETIYWTGGGKTQEEIEKIITEDGGFFADVIIKAGENYVGYAVIEILKVEEPIHAYYAKVQQAYCFPMIDGKFQDVSEVDIQEMIAQCRK